jgi:signal transduction histidine kinase
MSFRKKLLLLFAATVLVCVAVISVSVYSTIRRSFEQADQDRANAVAAQFRSEFQRRGSEVARKIESVAASEAVQRIALDMNRGGADPSEYVGEARALANQQRLDFLELVDARGTILSSAQWQAKFGYPEAAIPVAIPQGTTSPSTTPPSTTPETSRSEGASPTATVPAGPFLKREDLPDGASLGLFAVRVARVGEQPLYVIGGERLDQAFLSTLDIPTGTRVMLYQNLDTKWNPKLLLDLNGPAAGADQIAPLIAKVRDTAQESQSVIHWTTDPADAEVFHAIPLTGPATGRKLDAGGSNQQPLGVLLVGSSRRPLIELQRRVISTAMLVGGAGILAAVLASLWFAARVSRPVVSLAEAARRVAAGDLNAKVEVESSDELGELAASFNRMTEDLMQQRDRAVQAERVAAWRELARRLAHELKNPLFPLQVTVENLMRAKEKSPEMFEEVFHESTATLLGEINNLKTIIGRFSEFSRMPQPQRHPTQVNDVVRSVLRVFQAQLQNKNQIVVRTELADALPDISADSELLHRALQNLVLNAIDAMPQGGELTIRTASLGDRVELSVSDTGSGLTQEECGRLFTPYYTTKQHGTGLGLAIVQSVVSDHGGKISVESTKEKGTTFRMELPCDFSAQSASVR